MPSPYHVVGLSLSATTTEHGANGEESHFFPYLRVSRHISSRPGANRAPMLRTATCPLAGFNACYCFSTCSGVRCIASMNRTYTVLEMGSHVIGPHLSATRSHGGTPNAAASLPMESRVAGRHPRLSASLTAGQDSPARRAISARDHPRSARFLATAAPSSGSSPGTSRTCRRMWTALSDHPSSLAIVSSLWKPWSFASSAGVQASGRGRGRPFWDADKLARPAADRGASPLN